MTEPDSLSATHEHLHYSLLRLAGRIPDEALVRCRELLADGQLGPLAQVMAFTATQYAVAMDARDIDLLRILSEDLSADAARLDQIAIGDGDLMPPYTFGDADGLDKEADGIAASLTEAVRAKAEELTVIGAWKAVRTPAGGAAWPPPRAVYAVEVEEAADAVGVYREVTAALSAAGEQLPLVEVFHAGTRLPSYQDVARLRGTLLWSPDDERPRLATVYDLVEEGQPGFHDDHVRLDEPERDTLAEYLRAGEPLLLSTALLPDVLDAGRTEKVPVSFRTDGFWIWSDAIAYYLLEHGIAPEPDLLEHLRSRAGTRPAPTGVQLYRALAVLEPGDPEPPADDKGPVDGPAPVPGGKPPTGTAAKQTPRRRKK